MSKRRPKQTGYLYETSRCPGYCFFADCRTETTTVVFAREATHGYYLCPRHATPQGYEAARMYWEHDHHE